MFCLFISDDADGLRMHRDVATECSGRQQRVLSWTYKEHWVSGTIRKA